MPWFTNKVSPGVNIVILPPEQEALPQADKQAVNVMDNGNMASVRNEDNQGSASSSASGSATESASGSAAGSATGSGDGQSDCHLKKRYLVCDHYDDCLDSSGDGCYTSPQSQHSSCRHVRDISFGDSSKHEPSSREYTNSMRKPGGEIVMGLNDTRYLQFGNYTPSVRLGACKLSPLNTLREVDEAGAIEQST